jgi:hypothetical protein
MSGSPFEHLSELAHPRFLNWWKKAYVLIEPESGGLCVLGGGFRISFLENTNVMRREMDFRRITLWWTGVSLNYDYQRS